MTQHILTKQQRAAGLESLIDGDRIILIDTTRASQHDSTTYHHIINVLPSTATIQEIQTKASDYLIMRRN